VLWLNFGDMTEPVSGAAWLCAELGIAAVLTLLYLYLRQQIPPVVSGLGLVGHFALWFWASSQGNAIFDARPIIALAFVSSLLWSYQVRCDDVSSIHLSVSPGQ
jgi:hypothetical protein